MGADHNNPVTCESKQVTRGRPVPLQKLVPKVPGSTKHDAVTQKSNQKNLLLYYGADHNNPVTCESKQVTRGRPVPLQKLVPKVPGSTKR
ncbi:hypothetical protein CEXT_421841 [Caerostris extrusa]|uniref:Uncharacterized protein n=1 Tax=Caerostris extrusa TaxID=172846 RepID=A0AAV4UJA2_CAEEX|nr:hypothetical protein CEXT_421841 [Caerostris extrusa]